MPKGKKIEPIDLQELESNPVYDGMYDHLKSPPAAPIPIGFTPTGDLSPGHKVLHVVRPTRPSDDAPEVDSYAEPGIRTSPAPTDLTPIGSEPPGPAPSGNVPTGAEPSDEINLADVEAELAAAPRPTRSRGKLVPATRVEHGHSATQDALYWYLWRLGKPVKGSRSHYVQAGYGQIQAGIGVDRSNVQDAIRELQKKLSIRVVKTNTVGSATIYEVFCCDDILAKRREAKLVWARAYGKRRVDLLTEAEISTEANGSAPIGFPPTGPAPGHMSPADLAAGVGDTPTVGMRLTPTEGVGFTPIQEGKEAKTSKESTTEILRLRVLLEEHLGLVDDEAPRKLIAACRARAGNSPVTLDQIMSIVRTKLAAARHARNPIGLLIEAVPKHFPLPSRAVETESAPVKPEDQDYWQRLVDDPNTPEALREQAKRLYKV